MAEKPTKEAREAQEIVAKVCQSIQERFDKYVEDGILANSIPPFSDAHRERQASNIDMLRFCQSFLHLIIDDITTKKEG